MSNGIRKSGPPKKFTLTPLPNITHSSQRPSGRFGSGRVKNLEIRKNAIEKLILKINFEKCMVFPIEL